MAKLRAILSCVRPGFDAELGHSDVIGPQFGFSSIDQVRVIAQIESALDVDLADEGVSVLNVGKLCQLLERSRNV